MGEARGGGLLSVETSSMESTFTSFVREHEPRLRWALVARFGPDRGREAAAEALAYGWVHWDRVAVMENPAGYLYRVGYRRGIRRRRRPVFPTPPERSEPWVEPGLPDALARLSGRQRTAVVLVHSFGWTYVEVAGVMGVSVSTVRNHVARGMAKLRAALEVQR